MRRVAVFGEGDVCACFGSRPHGKTACYLTFRAGKGHLPVAWYSYDRWFVQQHSSTMPRLVLIRVGRGDDMSIDIGPSLQILLHVFWVHAAALLSSTLVCRMYHTRSVFFFVVFVLFVAKVVL